MARNDDDPWSAPPRPKPTTHEIGQPLDTLSVGELGERIEQLQTEIARLEETRRAKTAAGAAADAFFKR